MNTPPAELEQSNSKQMNRIKLALGCTGVAMVLCTGIVMLTLIVMPIAFRSLPPEYQDKFSRRLPFLNVWKPTQPAVAFLPTVASTSAAAMDLLNTPLPPESTLESLATAAPTKVVPTPALATNTPVTPTKQGQPAASPTPVIAIPTLPPATPTLIPTATQPPIPSSYHSTSFEWVPQGWNNCGPANLTQAMQFYGWKGKQDDAAGFLKPNREDKNVSPWQMVDYVNSQSALKSLWRVAGSLDLIKRLVSNKFAVIMETGYDVAGEGWMGHYLTVIGYDDNLQLLYGLDTWLGDGKDHLGMHEEYDDVDRRWQAFNRTYIVVYTQDREAELAAILGPDADLQYNYYNALSVARTEASAQPNMPFPWFNIGSSYTLLGKYKEAAIAFDQAQSVGNIPYRMLWYQFTPYEAYYNTGNYSQVLALAGTVLNTTPYVEETYYWQGMAYAAQGKAPMAIEAFKRALRYNPNYAPANEMLAKVQDGSFAPPVIAQAGQ